jgi:hypothetical protein
MATGFPTTSIDSYSTKVNNVNTVAAGDVNDLQDAVVAIETALGVPTYRGSALTTWTPTISFATAPTGGSIAYTTQTGHYARFGGIVWFNGFIVLSSIGTGGGGAATIGGLPVASATSGLLFYHPCITTSSGVFTTNTPTICRVNNGATTIGIFHGSNTTAIAAISYANFTNTSNISFTGWYFHA